MAVHESARAITVEAGSAITRCRFIVMAADGQYDHVGVAQSAVDGISGEAATGAGKQIPMIVPDGCIAKVEAGAATTRGGLVASDNAGKAIDYVEAVNNIAIGRFREAASGTGQIVEIEFFRAKTGGGT